MEYFIFAMATLILAISFPHWEPTGLSTGSGGSRLLGALGVFAHLGGSAAIGWSSGIVSGIGAFILVPICASALYSLLVSPFLRDRRTQRRAASPRHAPHRTLRQL